MAIRPLGPLLANGENCLAAGQFEDALMWYGRALALAPDLPQALAGTGDALLALGRVAEALAAFEKMGAGSDLAARGAGEALSQLGRMDDARAALMRAVALSPGNASHHYALAHIGRFVENDPRLAGLASLAARMTSLPPPAQCELHFALAKACDETGRCAEAFGHWQAGNAIRRRHFGYDEAMYLGILRELAAAFPAASLAKRRWGYESDVPVFVVGMPRSGTTLVEQILASHPAVFGAGESMVLHCLLGEGMVGADFPAQFDRVTDGALRALGEAYVGTMQAMAPAAARIVDKLPANFMLCGLIHQALPGARIVHVMRDPLDTCFSCYANLFSRDIDYAYDLAELGRYYRAYTALMDHWRAVLPAGAMIDLRYESLIADLPGEARRLVAFCGLPWDERCLSFYQTRRVVQTLSAAQVRQPLYANAVGRAEPYRLWLGPLIAALENNS